MKNNAIIVCVGIGLVGAVIVLAVQLNETQNRLKVLEANIHATKQNQNQLAKGQEYLASQRTYKSPAVVKGFADKV